MFHFKLKICQNLQKKNHIICWLDSAERAYRASPSPLAGLREGNRKEKVGTGREGWAGEG